MKRINKIMWLAGILFFLVSCSPQDAEIEEILETPSPIATLENQTEPTDDRSSTSGIIRQWAISAQASTEFASPEWSADQALGSPNSPGCGDYQFSWASAASDSIDTIILEYERVVLPLEIRIHQSYNADQVVKVEVFDSETGGFYTVLQKNPVQVDRPCPYELVVPVEKIEFMTSQIRITIDQSQLGLGWNEIDAVQLIGSTEQP